MGFVLNFILFLVLIPLTYILMRKSKKRAQRRAKLPPGSMGWPYVGETLQLYSQDPNDFFAAKQKRYGEIFKTHLLGCPCVMLASPEAAKFVLVNQAHLFKPTYPRSKEQMIGQSALFFHQGEYHTRLRKLVQSSLSPDALRNLVPDIESIAISILDSWAGGRVINTFHEMKKFSFDVGILSIFGNLDAKYKEELKKNYFIMDEGYNSFPTNIPGTAYNKAVLARKRLSKILNDVICERKERTLGKKDLLDHLLNFKDEHGNFLADNQIADNIIGVLFAAQDTTASVLTWILKYLHDYPKLLECVKAEQMAIYESNERGNRPLTWVQTRNMPLTHKVILESLRMASIISFTFREAVADVEYKGKLVVLMKKYITGEVGVNFITVVSKRVMGIVAGFLIPKGWKVMPLFRSIHHNPEFFKDPHKFDPSRFEVSPKPNTFLPFGNGVHACPGNELAKLQILIFTHHLVTKHRWKVVGCQSGIQYAPFPVPNQGLPARFWKDSCTPIQG